MRHRAAHALDDFLAGLAIAVDIGVGEKLALAGRRADIAVERRRVAHESQDLGGRQPFGDHQTVLDHAAGGDDFERLQNADTRREFVFAGLQGAAARREAGGELKYKAVTDDAFIRQQIADRADAALWQDHERARFRQRTGALGLAIEPIAGRAEHRDNKAGGDHAPGEETEKGSHARTPPSPSPATYLTQFRQSLLIWLRRFAPLARHVIPGSLEERGPESILQRPVFMDSGLAAPLGARVRAPVGWRIFDAPGRPGMTIRGYHGTQQH